MVQANSSDPGALSNHLHAVAERTDCPTVVQDYPVITGIRIMTADLTAAVRDVPSAVAVSPADPESTAVAELAAGLDVPIFGGLGGPVCSTNSLSALLAHTGFRAKAYRVCDGVPRRGFDAAREVWRDYLPLANRLQAGIALTYANTVSSGAALSRTTPSERRRRTAGEHVRCSPTSAEHAWRVMSGIYRGLASYGDPEFSRFLRGAFLPGPASPRDARAR